MAKACSVVFTDLNGLRHTVELEADSVYEAVVLALQALRKSPFVELPPGGASRFQVCVREAVVTHEVSLRKVQEWVNAPSPSPAETVRRRRLKDILAPCLPKPA